MLNNVSTSYEQTVWVKDGIARIETTLSRQRGSLATFGMILEEGKEKIIQYQIQYPQNNNVSSMTTSIFASGRSEGNRAMTFLAVIDQLESNNSTVIGVEKVANRPCYIVSCEGGKLWIDARDFVPLRIEENGMITQFKRVKIGPGSVKDIELKMPENATLIREAQRPHEPPDFPIAPESYSKYKPLTTEQLDKFLEEKNMIPLAIREIALWTIVLYENETEMGGYILTASPDGKIHESKSHGNNNSDIVPVSIGGGGSYSQDTGSVSYTRVIINDPQIQKEAHVIEVYEGEIKIASEPVNGQRGIIIPGLLKMHQDVKSNVIIRDKEGNELFNNQNTVNELGNLKAN
jgi:hypothetical protein